MKRICLVRHCYYPDDLHVRRDAETLTEHGYQVDVICLKKKVEKSQEIVRGVKVYRLPVEHRRRGAFRYFFEYSAFFLLAFWKLTCLSLKKRYQAVEVDNMPDFLVFTSLIPKLFGAKIVFYFFELTPEVYADSFGVGTNHVMVKLLCWVEKVSTKWADHCIVANGICQQEILKGRGIPASKMSVVLNVPDENLFRQRSSSISDHRRFCVITHGSLLKRYGIQTLIRAVSLLTDKIRQLEVRVLGDGEYRQDLEALVESLGVTESVRFTGFVPLNDMLFLLTQANLGVVSLLPQKQPQLPNKLFEYLALGKPIVSTSLPAIKAYFDDNAVMFYEPDNERDLARCILELYENPEKKAALTTFASAIYQKYRWATMKHEYLKVFDRLLKGS